MVDVETDVLPRVQENYPVVASCGVCLDGKRSRFAGAGERRRWQILCLLRNEMTEEEARVEERLYPD